MITITDVARQKIVQLLGQESRQGLALRFAADAKGRGGFNYRLGFVGPEERRADDTVIDAGGFEVFIDAASVPRLEGASLDFIETLQESGFKIDNPNSAWADPVAAAVQRVLDTDINPAVAMHGGYVELLDVRDGVAYISMSGGCQGCGMADVTLRQGVESRIKEAVPAIGSVIDTTDHASGTNPYYEPSAGGSSPVA